MKQFLILAAWLIAVTTNAQNRNENPLATTALQKLIVAEANIKQLYVEEVDEEKMVEEAIKNMLSQLDPHSSYTPAKDVKALTEPLEGNFEGIGVQYNMVDDTLVIVQPVSDGPSEKVGIMAGDRIITVNDTSIANLRRIQECRPYVTRPRNARPYSRPARQWWRLSGSSRENQQRIPRKERFNRVY